MKLSRISLFFSDIKPLLLSHHPNCNKFSKHVFHVGKYKLCIGCFTFYPVVGVTILSISMFLNLNFVTLAVLFFLSFAFFTPIILNISGLTRYRFLKIFSKISIGIGTGFLIVSTLFLPFFIIIKILILIEINFIVGVIAYIRNKHVKEVCLDCEYKSNWDTCPGMKSIMKNLYEHDFKKRENEE
ncbi:hypothetical protein LCGC14_0735720 [marine sediment metagenome]|uniref:DUF2085 domain-containing protein n=1 Tax=marine sediment metagenome TaxID=412755 RepID=A0A0F9QT57_9ZZZZ|nr:MAG: hypothetical protein Lokiarch_39050 [Candidatus Lokiarchaeum sp. GC14_75]